MADDRPMAAAEMQYDDDGRPAWGEMWQTFCTLAVAGGPPHRAAEDQLEGTKPDGENYTQYFAIREEIIRGIAATTGLAATRCNILSWVEVHCDSEDMAAWMVQAIQAENVAADQWGKRCLVPVGPNFRVDQEIKSVITAVAKVYHYWATHRAEEAADGPAVEVSADRQRTRLAIREALAQTAPPVFVLEPGTPVFWERIGKSSITYHQGTIISVDGPNALIQNDKRRKVTVPVAKLRTKDQPSVIAAFVDVIRESRKE